MSCVRISQKSRRDTGSTPVVGSSSSSTSGTATSACASATRFLVPPLSSPTARAPSRLSWCSVVSTRCSQFHASSASMRVCSASRSVPASCASYAARTARASATPSLTTSNTVAAGSNCGSCGT